MGRPPLPIGSHGVIRVRPWGDGFRAWANYRDDDGRTRLVSRIGRSEAGATRNLRTALAQRAGPDIGEVSGETRVRQVAALWLAELDRAAKSGRRSPNTVRLYRGVLELHVLPGVGDLRLREVSVTRCDRCLVAVAEHTGPSTARTARSALSGVLGYAVRHGGMGSNPVRDVSRIEAGPRKVPRGMTDAERTDWLARMQADLVALRQDVPDLTRMMLATGVRIGEVLALSFDNVDLGARTVTIDWQIIRVTGAGLRRVSTKTTFGERTLRLPMWAVSMLRRRRLLLGGGPVFPSARGGWRDPSNVSRCFREARERVGYGWVTSHVFRKTVATVLDEADLAPRQVADQLGHSRPSLTQDVYMARRAVGDAAAVALEAIDPDRPVSDA